MRKAIIIILFGIAAAWVQGCSKGPEPAAEKPKIAATIFPVCDIARNIVGDRMDVIGILPPGAGPHTYGVSPRQVRELEGVGVVFSVGHGLDDWIDTLIETLPNVKKVVVDKGIHLIELSSDEDHEGREHGDAAHRDEGANPHYWLSIKNGKSIARNITDEVIKLDPAGESEYAANLEAYLAELDSAAERIKKKIGGLPTKKIMTFHDAWVYYADEFGLEIVGTFEPFPGKQPTPKYLARLYDEAGRHGVTSLFSEPQLSSDTAASFVSDMGLELYVLDPLGGVEGRDGYIEMLEYNTEVIAEALSNGRR